VAGTADPAFATDEQGRIIIWNKAAGRLLGRDPAQVLGRLCHQIICGTDVFGNRYCSEHCALVEMVRRREALHHFEMDVAGSSGDSIRVSFSIIVVPGPGATRFSLVHIFRPASRGREADELLRRILTGTPGPAPAAVAASIPQAASRPASLTAREIEVLHRMADGESTKAIADSLFISTTTVRNHIQHILQKLEAHSKMEAVSLALRNRLI
jgi:DNA-binding CsgD family transcriptional regulator